MSLGYAQKLSYREHVGTVGMPESFDSLDTLDQKVRTGWQRVRTGWGTVGGALGAQQGQWGECTCIYWKLLSKSCSVCCSL